MINSNVPCRLEGKVALITGAARGLGECTARLFAKHGAKVVIADIVDDLGEAVSKTLPDSTYVHCDVTNESDVQNAVDTVVSKYGKLDIMFNNAGLCDGNKDIRENELSDFTRIVSVNLTGVFLGTKCNNPIFLKTYFPHKNKKISKTLPRAQIDMGQISIHRPVTGFIKSDEIQFEKNISKINS